MANQGCAEGHDGCRPGSGEGEVDPVRQRGREGGGRRYTEPAANPNANGPHVSTPGGRV